MIDDYKDGYRVGYYYGRLAATNGEPYDDRTPGEKGAPTPEKETADAEPR